MPPITLLDWIANDEGKMRRHFDRIQKQCVNCFIYLYLFTDLSADDSSSVASYNHFPEGVASDMIRIANWLSNESRDEYMNVYARIRANVLMKSLTMLKDHQRSASGGSIQGVTASPTIVGSLILKENVKK